jgi:hypothetical protein
MSEWINKNEWLYITTDLYYFSNNVFYKVEEVTLTKHSSIILSTSMSYFSHDPKKVSCVIYLKNFFGENLVPSVVFL